ncbi:hypothetical protein SFUMM280S_08797 [Streptomyces fumanus]
MLIQADLGRLTTAARATPSPPGCAGFTPEALIRAGPPGPPGDGPQQPALRLDPPGRPHPRPRASRPAPHAAAPAPATGSTASTRSPANPAPPTGEIDPRPLGEAGRPDGPRPGRGRAAHPAGAARGTRRPVADADPGALSVAARCLLPLVQITPRGLRAGAARSPSPPPSTGSAAPPPPSPRPTPPCCATSPPTPGLRQGHADLGPRRCRAPPSNGCAPGCWGRRWTYAEFGAEVEAAGVRAAGLRSAQGRPGGHLGGRLPEWVLVRYATRASAPSW